MRRISRKIVCTAVAAALAFAGPAAGGAPSGGGAGAAFGAEPVSAAMFTDVPSDSWALNAVTQAKTLGLMSGTDDTHFGYGRPMTRAEFVTILCSMLKWTVSEPESPSFSDVAPGEWYYPYVETALAHNVMDKAGSFAPTANITREQAAVMFVRALGLDSAAALEKNTVLPFTDVPSDSSSRGYIAVAKNIGMMSGTSAATFNPTGTAKREEVASMITEVYSDYYGKTEFLHGFYAISSYSQRELAKDMDAVTFMWSTMTLDDRGVWLNTGADGSNQFKVPDSYEDATSYMDANGVKTHLGVYMDVSAGAGDLLRNAESRAAAVTAITDELTKVYEAAGKNPYSGVTIDFEGLKGQDSRQALNDFLTSLSSKLKDLDKTLYVAVQPVMADGVYFDGYDYRAIGTLADKVILMAHDYAPASLSGYEGTEYYKNAALTPISQIYWALKAATDDNAGVADKSKLALAISFDGKGWKISEDGKLQSPAYASYGSQTLAALLADPLTQTGFSQTYRNPYLTSAADSQRSFVWYEDSRSVFEKAALARLFGVNGISIWRLGNIPAYQTYDATESYR